MSFKAIVDDLRPLAGAGHPTNTMAKIIIKTKKKIKFYRRDIYFQVSLLQLMTSVLKATYTYEVLNFCS